jgi:hypothetical protein
MRVTGAVFWVIGLERAGWGLEGGSGNKLHRRFGKGHFRYCRMGLEVGVPGAKGSGSLRWPIF